MLFFQDESYDYFGLKTPKRSNDFEFNFDEPTVKKRCKKSRSQNLDSCNFFNFEYSALNVSKSHFFYKSIVRKDPVASWMQISLKKLPKSHFGSLGLIMSQSNLSGLPRLTRDLYSVHKVLLRID